MPSRQSYFPQIDGLRFYAVLAVAIHHWFPLEVLNDFKLGRLGVELFFVISGFLITRILMQSKERIGTGDTTLGQSYKVFYVRRILRIFPIYYFVLLVTFIFNDGIVRESFVWNATFTSNFFILFRGEWAGTVSHFWSLAVEEQFYLIWPFLVFMVPKRHLLRFFVLTCILSLGVRAGLFFSNASLLHPYVLMPACLDVLAIGGVLAYLYEYQLATMQRLVRSPWVLSIALAGLAGCTLTTIDLPYHNFYYYVLYRTFSSLLFFVVVGNAVLGIKGPLQHVLSHRHIVLLGKTSYSMYLFHNFIPGFFLGMKSPEHDFLRFWIYFIAMAIVSYIAWRFIEMPFNGLKKRFRY